MDIITLDIESFYSQEYSLTKLTTEQYVRDPKFETILVGLAVNNEKPTWFSGDDASTRSYLHERISPDSVLIAHNAAFDAAILSWRYDVRPGLIMDTVSMGRALVGEQSGASLAKLAGFFGFGEKGTEVLQAKGKRRADFSVTELEQYAKYCMNDVVLCRALAHKMLETFPESELEIVDMTMRMFTEPALVLNRPLLEAYLKRVVERREKLLADAGVTRELLMSNDKLATVLQALDVDPPRKVSARTGKEAWAFAKTDEAFVALADHDDEMVSAIVSARLGVKSTQEETRIQFFMDIADRGTLPIALKYSGAGTHRYSGSDKQNIQNLPARDDAKKDLKRSIRAPDGMVIVSADSSQIEARLTPYFCGQQDLVDIFAEGRDPYCEFATMAYNRTITKADKSERFVGKTCIAEGTLILTDRGEIPIQSVTLDDRLWDGVEWVSHEGVIYNGVRHVIEYQGLTATPDHGVCTRHGAVPFGIAASSMEDLVRSGSGRETVRVGSDQLGGNTTPEAEHLRVNEMYQLWYRKMDPIREPETRYVERMPALLAKKVPPFRGVGKTLRRYHSAMQQYVEPCIQALWWAWDHLRFQVSDGVHPMGAGTSTASGLQRGGDRPYRQRRELLLRKSAISNAGRTTTEPTEFRQDHVEGAAYPTTGIPESIRVWMDVQAGTTRTNRRADNATLCRVYDIQNAGPRRRYTAGNYLVLNCILGLGYGTGRDKLQGTLKSAKERVILTPDESQRLVDLYRTRYPRIVQMWNHLTRVIHAMMKGQYMRVDDRDLIRIVPDGLMGPTGLVMNYPKLHTRKGEDGRDEIVYWSERKRSYQYIYGAKLLENCLGPATEVLTDRGWVAIVDVRDADMLWDGLEWVHHTGLNYSGVNKVIDFGGVLITPDHEVLINETWYRSNDTNYQTAASSSARHYWFPAGSTDRSPLRWIYRHKKYLGSALRLWERSLLEHSRCRKEPIVRVQTQCTDIKSHYQTWDVHASSVLGMAGYGRQMHAIYASGLAQLRSAWRHSVPAVGRTVREFLGRHGANVLDWAGSGPNRQQRRVLAGELPVGDAHYQYQQSSVNSADRYPHRQDVHCPSSASSGIGGNHNALSGEAQLACRDVVSGSSVWSPTYDLTNAGPRHRFTVRGADERPFIVHNCIQHLARCVIAEQMVRINERYKVLFQVHDEIVLLAPESEADEALQFVMDVMRRAPAWAPGLPVNCEAGYADNYGDA